MQLTYFIIFASVVTSVSVIMNGDGEAPHFTDAVGKTVPRPFLPPQVASPINLLNPDRYEFYTFNDNGELVKRLMTLKEIQSIVANGNGAMIGDNEPESHSVILNSIPLSNHGAETKVQDIVDNVQNVLSREMENNKNISQIPAELLDTPDVSSSWSMILPAIFGNTGDEIMPHKPINMTPETDIVDTTTQKFSPTRKSTTKAPPSKTVSYTKAQLKTNPSTAPPTKMQSTSTTQMKTTAEPTKPPITSTKKQTVKPKPKPTTTIRTTTIRAVPETTFAETTIKATSRPSTLKVTPTKKTTKKPTAASLRPLRPMTNSPIIIEYIEKKPLRVESKTERISTMKTTNAPSSTTVEKSTDPSTQEILSFAASSGIKSSYATRTEAPSTTSQHQTSTDKPKSQTTTATTTQVVSEATQMMSSMEQTTASSSEEDRRDTAINQIIGSLQSDLFNSYERITTIDPVDFDTTVHDEAMEKIGDLNLVPDKVLLNDQLFIDEEDPIVRNLPSTTAMPVEITTYAPSFEKLEATTVKVKSDASSLENSEVMQAIEKLIQEQVKTKHQPEKLDVLGFDDYDETEIKLDETLESKKNLTQSQFITKAATVASILSTKLADLPKTTTVAPSEESDTTVPTILSDALSNVIQLMMREQEAKKTTTARPEEPTEFDLNKILHHYQNFNSQQDQLEALSMLNEKFVAVPTVQPEIDETTMPPTEKITFETTVVKETSSVSMKKGDVDEKETEMPDTTMEPERMMTTTDMMNGEFSTFFYIDKSEEETTLDTLGDFTTEQFVGSEKRFSDRKEESYMSTLPPLESEEESNELVADVLNVIGIASDEEETSSEKLKSRDESAESDEVESVISSLTSTLDNTFATDVKTDFKLTSKIASSLISVADTISETLNGDNSDDESEEVSTMYPTTIASVVKQETITKQAPVTEIIKKVPETFVETTERFVEATEKTIDVTEQSDDATESPTTIEPEAEETSTEYQEMTEQTTVFEEASTEKEEKSSEIIEKSSDVINKSSEKEQKSSEADEKISQMEQKSSEIDLAESENIAAAGLEAASHEEELKPKSEEEIVERKPDSSPMVQLSIIRKDSSLEEIDFITPPTPTSTRIPITEGNYVKIDSIETTSLPKVNGFKNKTTLVKDDIRPIYIALRSTTTSKTNALPEVASSPASFEQSSKSDETVVTERVPLIEVLKPLEKRPHLSSTEDNLVEVKIQTKPTFSVPTVSFPSATEEHHQTISQSNAQVIKNNIKNAQQQLRPQSPPIDLSSSPEETLGLAASTAHLSSDLSDFAKLCNELAFTFWKSITAEGISQSRSVIISPFALTSTLSMIFLGARGQTSGEMNDLLRLDDMVSFNPHVIFRNISESIEQSRKSGIAAAAFVRELYSDRSKGKLLPYFKEKAQQFYGAHVEEVNFSTINDILRRRTNLLVKRHTMNKINEYLKTNNIWVNDPLAAVSANVFLVSFLFVDYVLVGSLLFERFICRLIAQAQQ